MSKSAEKLLSTVLKLFLLILVIFGLMYISRLSILVDCFQYLLPCFKKKLNQSILIPRKTQLQRRTNLKFCLLSIAGNNQFYLCRKMITYMKLCNLGSLVLLIEFKRYLTCFNWKKERNFFGSL